MTDSELENLSDRELLMYVARTQRFQAQTMIDLTNELNQVRDHDRNAIDGLGRRVKHLEFRMLDTEPAPAPSPTNGDAS